MIAARQTTQNDSSLDQYIADVQRHPVLSREDEMALATHFFKTKDEKAAQRLVVSNLRFVVKVAHEYKGYGFRLLDLIQEGNVGLILAVNKFEPSRGYRLISYAVWWVRAYIQNFIMRSWSLVKLGTTQAQRKLFFKLRSERERAERALRGQGIVDADALAESLGVKAQELQEMGVRLSSHDFSLDAEVTPGSGRTHLQQLAYTSEVGDQETQVVNDDERQVVRRTMAGTMALLSEKERYIIEHRLMADEPKTLQAIGKAFHISRERARQIEGNAIRKMRAAFKGSDVARLRQNPRAA